MQLKGEKKNQHQEKKIIHMRKTLTENFRSVI